LFLLGSSVNSLHVPVSGATEDAFERLLLSRLLPLRNEQVTDSNGLGLFDACPMPTAMKSAAALAGRRWTKLQGGKRGVREGVAYLCAAMGI
jgi:hypothetical protein